jgi:hypothetical protein
VQWRKGYIARVGEVEFNRGEFGFVPSSFESRLNNCLLCGLFFSYCQRKKLFDRTIIFATFIKSRNRIKWRRIMKKTDKKSGLLCVEVSVDIDLTTNVNLGKRGGGGAVM